MNFRGVIINVADLNRSIEFYRDVFGFDLLSQEEQLAAVGPSGEGSGHVIILRALGSSPASGGRHIGLRSFLMEVETVEQLDRIGKKLEAREVLDDRRERSRWTAIVGHDPDWVTVVVVCNPKGGPIAADAWKVLDDFLYGIGE
jgi:catechol 2,3-dioxygenase-like lactoylglutathione lyase family enzyme